MLHKVALTQKLSGNSWQAGSETLVPVGSQNLYAGKEVWTDGSVIFGYDKPAGYVPDIPCVPALDNYLFRVHVSDSNDVVLRYLTHKIVEKTETAELVKGDCGSYSNDYLFTRDFVHHHYSDDGETYYLSDNKGNVATAKCRLNPLYAQAGCGSIWFGDISWTGDRTFRVTDSGVTATDLDADTYAKNATITIARSGTDENGEPTFSGINWPIAGVMMMIADDYYKTIEDTKYTYGNSYTLKLVNPYTFQQDSMPCECVRFLDDGTFECFAGIKFTARGKTINYVLWLSDDYCDWYDSNGYSMPNDIKMTDGTYNGYNKTLSCTIGGTTYAIPVSKHNTHLVKLDKSFVAVVCYDFLRVYDLKNWDGTEYGYVYMWRNPVNIPDIIKIKNVKKAVKNWQVIT